MTPNQSQLAGRAQLFLGKVSIQAVAALTVLAVVISVLAGLLSDDPAPQPASHQRPLSEVFNSDLSIKKTTQPGPASIEDLYRKVAGQ